LVSENQKIQKTLEGTLADLRTMLRKLGLSEAEIEARYVAVLEENGIAAQLVRNLTAQLFPLSATVDPKPENLIEQLRRLRSGEFAEGVLSQPELTAEDSKALRKEIRIPLANLGQHFKEAGKAAPRHKLGGRDKVLDDPALHDRIRNEIEDLRKQDICLKDIYKRLANKYGVSDTTIKRIKQEKSAKNDKI